MPKDMVGQPCVYGHIINEKNIAFFRQQNPALEDWESFEPKRLLSTAASMLAHGHYPSYSVRCMTMVQQPFAGSIWTIGSSILEGWWISDCLTEP